MGPRPEDVTSPPKALKHWGTGEYGEAWADRSSRGAGIRPSEESIRLWAKKERNACTRDVAEALTRIYWQSTSVASFPPCRRRRC